MFDIDTSFDASAVRASIVDVVTQALDLLLVECGDDAARVDRVRAVDRAVAALAASQVVDSDAFYVSQMVEQERLGVPLLRRGRGIADQLGLATKRSPVAASRRLSDARALVADMPDTLSALAAGRVSELERRSRSGRRHVSPPPTGGGSIVSSQARWTGCRSGRSSRPPDVERKNWM